jgi:hypothetical protein
VFTELVVKPIFVAELEKESFMSSATEVQRRRDRLLSVYLVGVISSLEEYTSLLQVSGPLMAALVGAGTKTHLRVCSLLLLLCSSMRVCVCARGGVLSPTPST